MKQADTSSSPRPEEAWFVRASASGRRSFHLLMFTRAWRIAAAIGLAVVLALKILREEQFLVAAYPEYADYRRRSWRLLPGVW